MNNNMSIIEYNIELLGTLINFRAEYYYENENKIKLVNAEIFRRTSNTEYSSWADDTWVRIDIKKILTHLQVKEIKQRIIVHEKEKALWEAFA